MGLAVRVVLQDTLGLSVKQHVKQASTELDAQKVVVCTVLGQMISVTMSLDTVIKAVIQDINRLNALKSVMSEVMEINV